MTTTRKKTKEKIEGLIVKLQAIEYDAVAIGLLYQDADIDVAGVMYAISKMVEVAVPLLQKTNEEL